ncbi:MAG: VWA domain-containing protein [Myxococcaceae bacterium]
MAWDEALFGYAWDGARRWFDRSPANVAAVSIEPDVARWEALARLISCAPLRVQPCDDGGGLDGDVLTLPRTVDLSPVEALNHDAVLVRVAWGAMLRRGVAQPNSSLSPSGERAGVRGDASGASPEPRDTPAVLLLARRSLAVRAALLTEFPSLATRLHLVERLLLSRRTTPGDDPRAQALEAAVRLALGATPSDALPQRAWSDGRELLEGRAWSTLPTPAWWRRTTEVAPVWLWGSFFRVRDSRPRVSAHNGGDGGGSASEPGTELQKKSRSRVERIETPKQDLHENPLVHSFEKVHTLERYQGGSKRLDGDDELAAHQKALDELDLDQVVRSHQATRGLYRADLLLDGGATHDDAPPPESDAVYDEWDEGAHHWRHRWCHLTSQVVKVVPEANAALSSVRARMARTTDGLRAVFEQLEAGRAWKLRQREGSDVDVAAVVDRFAALRAGHSTHDRLYAHRRRHARELAVLVLLDASLSTDAWVANRRVLDVEKEAVVALGDALDGLFDEVAVAAFCSQTRRDCRFLVAKGLHESWDVGVQRVMSLEPRGFTRIGPALRHATAKLNECGARQKLLVLLSDGKPSDVDHYEGRYGMADVHRAVLDAQATGVVTHALALDPSARRWLPSMFGHGRSTVVGKPADLVDALAKVTTQALRR